MSNYILKISGWELDASAHNLTDVQVDTLNDYQEEMGIDDLSKIGAGLEDVIDGYSPYDTNMWKISKPLASSDNTYFYVEDEDGLTVLEFTLSDVQSIDDINETHEFEEVLQGYPEEDNNENILLWLEENKGLVCEFHFSGDETPTVGDFAWEPNCIETPDADWGFVNRVYFKGIELDFDYDEQFVRGKDLTVELWTLKDLED